jgi:hypothetical protein
VALGTSLLGSLGAFLGATTSLEAAADFDARLEMDVPPTGSADEEEINWSMNKSQLIKIAKKNNIEIDPDHAQCAAFTITQVFNQSGVRREISNYADNQLRALRVLEHALMAFDPDKMLGRVSLDTVQKRLIETVETWSKGRNEDTTQAMLDAAKNAKIVEIVEARLRVLCVPESPEEEADCPPARRPDFAAFRMPQGWMDAEAAERARKAQCFLAAEASALRQELMALMEILKRQNPASFYQIASTLENLLDE